MAHGLQSQSAMSIPARTEWLESYTRRSPSFPPLDRDWQADVAIAGGGITGLTLARQLAVEGLNVVLVERGRIGSGTSGATTAHITAALDIDYETLMSRFGEAAARLVIESVNDSIDRIEKTAGSLGSGCGFTRLPGYKYTEDAGDLAALEREAEIGRRLGADVRLVEARELPSAWRGALRFERQAQFHPLAYLDGLATDVVAAGGVIFEHTAVIDAHDGGFDVAGGHRVGARHVVHATHTPIGLVAAVQTRLAAITSYVLAAQLETPVLPALYWDSEDPYHYVRPLGDGTRILAGGEDHPTGRQTDTKSRHQNLERWVRTHYPVRAIEQRWSHEFFEPADGLPYVGALPGGGSQLVAAGYSGTGMTFGTMAAGLLFDLIVRGSSQWKDIYSPSRLKPLAAGRAVAVENARIGWRFVADRLKTHGDDDDLANGSGRVTRIDGKQVAVYRDLRGELHHLSPRCTHLGCIVAWNDSEKTWDCPCHGGRFHPTGKVLYGPPVEDLRRARRSEG
jgi:glycine/D-amino acid oxidase-like deaminating enzyme/nitrite reductase/ring-hydroxylating ferredoxin subunit